MCLSSEVVINVQDVFTVDLFDTIQQVPQEIWDHLIRDHFYAAHAHLSVVEQCHKDQFGTYYFIVSHGDEPIAALYFQLIRFPVINAVRNFKTRERNRKLSWYYPLLYLLRRRQVPLLQSGNVFFTGDNGIYFSDGISDAMKRQILEKVINDEKWERTFSGNIAATMFSSFRKATTLPVYTEFKFHELETEPDLCMSIDAEWMSFDCYVKALSSKYRQRVNKVLSHTRDLRLRPLSAEEIGQAEEQLMALYRNVAQRASFNMALLETGYLTGMKALYGDQFEVIAYYFEDRLAGFSSAFIQGSEKYVHFIGMDYTVNDVYPLYHRMLFEFVRSGIDKACTRLYLGRTATEIKTTIGAQPVEMHNYIRLEKGFLNCFLPSILRNYGARPYIARSPYKQINADTTR